MNDNGLQGGKEMFLEIKDLKKAKVKSLILKGIRYDFDFEQNIWVEHNAD